MFAGWSSGFHRGRALTSKMAVGGKSSISSGSNPNYRNDLSGFSFAASYGLFYIPHNSLTHSECILDKVNSVHHFSC